MKKLTRVLAIVVLSPLVLIGGIAFTVTGSLVAGWQSAYNLFNWINND